MSLSSRPPNQAARVAGSSSALSDAMSAFNFQHYGNAIISNSLVAGLAQYLSIDEMFSSNAGENQFVSALKEGAWVSTCGQAGGMLRTAVPMIRIF